MEETLTEMQEEIKETQKIDDDRKRVEVNASIMRTKVSFSNRNYSFKRSFLSQLYLNFHSQSQIGKRAKETVEKTKNAIRKNDKSDKNDNDGEIEKNVKKGNRTQIEEADDEEMYIVEKICDHKENSKKKKNNLSLLIKWKGYDTPTWESETVMRESINDDVDIYLKNHRTVKKIKKQERETRLGENN